MTTIVATDVSKPQLNGLESPGRASTTLTGDAIRLMLHVEEVAPLNKLADAFPHIVNKLANVWKRPYLADRYFDELLHDTRGSRAGFPLTVLTEISNLFDYYSTKVFPIKQDTWSKALFV